MRRLILSTSTAALLGGAAYAGSLSEPVMEPVMEPAVVEQDTSSSAGGVVVPLLLLLILVAAVSQGNSSPPAPSDRRLKTDLEWVGLTRDSIPVYRYRYRGLDQRFEGVMAQDVLARRPDAILHWAKGVLAVDYAKLGCEMRLV